MTKYKKNKNNKLQEEGLCSISCIKALYPRGTSKSSHKIKPKTISSA